MWVKIYAVSYKSKRFRFAKRDLSSNFINIANRWQKIDSLGIS